MTAEVLSSEVETNAITFKHSAAWSRPVTVPEAAAQWLESANGRSKALGSVLRKLHAKGIPGKEHVEEYLRDQHRRHCRPNTLRSTFSSIHIFLSFVKVSHLEEISKEDVFAFIEHEQDRGMKPSTVNTRVRTVKAFIGFLVERGVVRPDIFPNRLMVKVPDSLPRALDPEDVKRLLTGIDHCRDRAME